MSDEFDDLDEIERKAEIQLKRSKGPKNPGHITTKECYEFRLQVLDRINAVDDKINLVDKKVSNLKGYIAGSAAGMTIIISLVMYLLSHG